MEGYNVGIRLGIVGSIFGDLSRIRGELGIARAEADKLQRSLLLGGAKLGLGIAGFHAIKRLSEPASEYLHLINMANLGGLRHASVVRMIGDAWKEAGQNSYTTVSQNMRALIDARKILGSTSGAFSVLPDIIQLQTAIAGSTDKRLSARSEDIAFGALKAIDILGKVRDPLQFRKNLSMMSQAVIWGQGRILPQDFQQAFKYERQSSLGLDSFFQYRILPSLMLEMKGSGGQGSSGGPGAMLAAFSRMAVQGIMSRSTAAQLSGLGLLQGGILNTQTVGTIATQVKGASLAVKNPFQWVQNVLLPAFHAKYGNLSNPKLQERIMQVFKGNQLATQLITWFANSDKSGNILRDAFQIGHAMDYRKASSWSMQHDPFVALHSMKSQWKNIGTAMYASLLKDALPLLQGFTKGLNALSHAMIEYPTLTKLVAGGFVALSGAMAISGTIKLLAVGFRLLGASLTPISLTPVGRILTAVATLVGLLDTLYGYQKQADKWKGAGVYDTSPATIKRNMALLYSANGGHPFFDANAFLKTHPDRDSRIHVHVHIDGKEMTKVVSRHMVDRHNHRTGATTPNPALSPAFGAH